MTSDAKVGLLLGLTFIFVIAFLINGLPTISDRARLKENQALATQLRTTLTTIFDKAKDPNDEQAISELTSEIQEKIADYILHQALKSSKNRSQVKEIIEAQLNEIEERVKKVEEKFPDETDSRKTALLSNALLGTRIDQLSKQVEQMQEQILTKWDVALIFCAIIVGIITIAGATCAILRTIGRRKRRY